MKRLILLLAICCITVPIIAQNAVTSSISVTGTAEQTLKPNFIRIQINVSNESSSAMEAQKATTASSSKVIAYLNSKAGVKKIETDYVRLHPTYRHESQKEQKYVATQSISFELHQMGEYNAVIVDLLNSGVNGINSIVFDSTEREKFEQELLAKAIADAREKATFMAKQLGQEVGKAIYVSDSNFGGPSPLPVYRNMAMMDDAESISPKELEINKSVQITFELK